MLQYQGAAFRVRASDVDQENDEAHDNGALEHIVGLDLISIIAYLDDVAHAAPTQHSNQTHVVRATIRGFLK